MDKLTQNKLKELLHYDPDSGLFTCNVSRGRAIKGNVAGSISVVTGYRQIRIDYKLYFAHRLVWLYCEGYFPETCVDHIDRDPSNNRRDNLRVVSQQCNSRNCGVSTNNKSGVTGVCWDPACSMWRARITVNRKTIHLGSSSNKVGAVQARWHAELRYKFPTCNTSSSARNWLIENNIK